MSSRLRLRALSAVTALGIVALAASPAAAATEVAKGTASAVTVTLAGTPAGSGTYAASNDGTNETSTGTKTPALTVLGGPGNKLISQGTLNQDAATKTVDGEGTSAACAGLSGQGATLVAVGDTDCLQGGKTLNLAAGAFSVQGLTVAGQSLASLPAPLGPLLASNAAAFDNAFQPALAAALKAVGNPMLNLDLSAVQGVCVARPGDAQGSANIAGAGISASLNGTSTPLVAFDPKPAPNTDVLVDLGPLSKLLTDELAKQLTVSTLFPAGSPLAALLTPLQQSDALSAALAQVGAQLQPVSSQLLKIVLNKQTRPDDSSIDVTALSVDVLPAASAFGIQPLSLRVGNVTCAAADAPQVAGPVAAPAIADADVPAEVDSGLAGDDSRGDLYRTLLGALLLLGAGGIAVRRLLVTRDAD